MKMSKKKAQKMCELMPFLVYCDGAEVEYCLGLDIENGTADKCIFDGCSASIEKVAGRIETKARI